MGGVGEGTGVGGGGEVCFIDLGGMDAPACWLLFNKVNNYCPSPSVQYGGGYSSNLPIS